MIRGRSRAGTTERVAIGQLLSRGLLIISASQNWIGLGLGLGLEAGVRARCRRFLGKACLKLVLAGLGLQGRLGIG